MFYDVQPEKQKEKYRQYLKIVGSLSNLYSDNTIPYLYYRAAENIFCMAFEAINHSRADISVDASKDKVGLGLKTFLHNNGRTFQKVAEFNALRQSLDGLSVEKIIETIANARNARINASEEIYGLEKSIYHCVTRASRKNFLYEVPLETINLKTITGITADRHIIKFNDGKNNYNFNISKSTLYKQFFMTEKLDEIDIDIIENPLEMLAQLLYSEEKQSEKNLHKIIFSEFEKKESLYLPLYAPSSKEYEPAPKSGLNQWNAQGRSRDPNEVYIPVPAWIHNEFPSFFPETIHETFELILPNGKTLSAKMCQQGLKGLMSNPNKELGKWILRDILKVPEGVLVTRQMLDLIDIDSVYIEKLEDSKYKIDFAKTGSYEFFKAKYIGDS